MVNVMAGENRKLRQCIPECLIVSAERERGHLLRVVKTAQEVWNGFQWDGRG